MNKADNTQYMDSLLLQALRQDDEKALSYLFSNYYNKLYRTGIRWCLDNHLTEESIQEVFQDLWQYRHTLGEIISFEAYLKASLKKRIARKAKNSDSETDESIENFPLPTESYEDILIKQEDSEIRKTQLSKALEELTPRQKEIIILKYFEELSYKEISDKTGLQVDTIYKVLHEGIKRLKGLLTSN